MTGRGGRPLRQILGVRVDLDALATAIAPGGGDADASEPAATVGSDAVGTDEAHPTVTP